MKLAHESHWISVTALATAVDATKTQIERLLQLPGAPKPVTGRGPRRFVRESAVKWARRALLTDPGPLPSRGWTGKEYTQVRKLYEGFAARGVPAGSDDRSRGIIELARKLQRTPTAVAAQASILGYASHEFFVSGRRWTAEEDERVRAAAAENRRNGWLGRTRQGRTIKGAHACRLEILAAELNRSYSAVRKRASKLGASSLTKDGVSESDALLRDLVASMTGPGGELPNFWDVQAKVNPRRELTEDPDLVKALRRINIKLSKKD